MLKSFFITLVLWMFVSITFAQAVFQPHTLKTEFTKDPLGIDVAHPRFSWLISSDQRNTFQSAYEIIISADAKDVATGKGTLWSTGKINSSQNINIEYNGKPLESFTRYYWRVRVYDQNNH